MPSKYEPLRHRALHMSLRAQKSALVILPAMIAVAAVAARIDQASRAERSTHTATELAKGVAQARSKPHGALAEPDFAQRLPEAAPTDPIVHELQRVSTAAGVTFVAISASSREATDRTLGHTDLELTLRGSYANLKGLISEPLDRHANLVLQHLTLRRSASPGDLEAHAAFVLLARPAIAPST